MMMKLHSPVNSSSPPIMILRCSPELIHGVKLWMQESFFKVIHCLVCKMSENSETLRFSRLQIACFVQKHQNDQFTITEDKEKKHVIMLEQLLWINFLSIS